MAMQEIKDTFFYKIDGQTIGYSLLQKSGLSPGQFYIKISDRYNFNAGRDVDIYKIISSTQADVYKANKYNYQSVATSSPPAPKNDSLYQSITIDGRSIGRVICNNQVVWQNQGRSTSASGGWQQLWQGTLSLDDVRLPAYRLYLFKSDYDSFIRSATDLIGSYESINGNTLIARYDHSNNQLLISGFGQNPVTIYGRN
ncbi:hypothetical protein [Streptococcus dysgalactiae]|uniref:Phage protein n=1 Tax=Streptococcus dysgalactiae subsp. equisimilis TaxID=119602 RepID=A0A9X8SY14_STREQ|nr:hypothetical protein [Streptococcus dysgalactiae]SQF66359.1 phage protein [Streptococcus dysgalactiae subsp. equisimilis]VEF04331.1 phage protein [Streptococcus dysgalactiae subsp. equisimilis]